MGLQAGLDIFKWFYFGESFSHNWKYKNKETAETKWYLGFNYPLIKANNFQLKGFILNEYTFDLEETRGTKNEIAIGLTVPFFKYFETSLNWRHIDLIHDYDSDTFEASITLIF